MEEISRYLERKERGEISWSVKPHFLVGRNWQQINTDHKAPLTTILKTHVTFIDTLKLNKEPEQYFRKNNIKNRFLFNLNPEYSRPLRMVKLSASWNFLRCISYKFCVFFAKACSAVAKQHTWLRPPTAQWCRSKAEKNILKDLFSLVLSQFKKYHPSGKLKFNNLYNF